MDPLYLKKDGAIRSENKSFLRIQEYSTTKFYAAFPDSLDIQLALSKHILWYFPNGSFGLKEELIIMEKLK